MSQNKHGGYGWVTFCREGDREPMDRPAPIMLA